MITLYYDIIWSVVYDPKAALNLGNVILVLCGRRRFTMRTEAQFRPAPSTRQPRGEVAGQLGIGMHHFLSWFYPRRADKKHTYSEREQRYSLVSIYGKKNQQWACALCLKIYQWPKQFLWLFISDLVGTESVKLMKPGHRAYVGAWRRINAYIK